MENKTIEIDEEDYLLYGNFWQFFNDGFDDSYDDYDNKELIEETREIEDNKTLKLEDKETDTEEDNEDYDDYY